MIDHSGYLRLGPFRSRGDARLMSTSEPKMWMATASFDIRDHDVERWQRAVVAARPALFETFGGETYALVEPAVRVEMISRVSVICGVPERSAR